MKNKLITNEQLDHLNEVSWDDFVEPKIGINMIKTIGKHNPYLKVLSIFKIKNKKDKCWLITSQENKYGEIKFLWMKKNGRFKKEITRNESNYLQIKYEKRI